MRHTFPLLLLLACTGDKDPSDPSVTLAPLTTSLCAPSPLIGTADPAGPSTGSLSLDGTQYDIDLLLGIDGAFAIPLDGIDLQLHCALDDAPCPVTARLTIGGGSG